MDNNIQLSNAIPNGTHQSCGHISSVAMATMRSVGDI